MDEKITSFFFSKWKRMLLMHTYENKFNLGIMKAKSVAGNAIYFLVLILTLFFLGLDLEVLILVLTI
jgi:hypothetical protein